jgi:AbrB family looped-hinge helix DNA binding protein
LRRCQVTRKRQVTIPKKLADKKGIRAGDAVAFEEARDDAILIKKVAVSGRDLEEARSAIDRFVREAPKVRRHAQAAGSRLNESLSRDVTAE